MKKILCLLLLCSMGFSCTLNKKEAGESVTSNQDLKPQIIEKEGKDAYWLDPQKGYEQRKALYLKYCAANDNEGGLDGIFSQIARMELGLPIDEAAIREGIAIIHSKRDCIDFTLGGLIRLMYLNQKNAVLSPKLVKDIENCMLGFKYWWDEPEKDIKYRCYHTENHQGLYHTDELLAAQLLKNRIFNDGKDGKSHLKHAIVRLERWLEYRTRFGFSEWLSNAYYEVDLMILVNLFDFAEDPEIRSRAGLLLDMLMYEMSLNNFYGVFGSTHGRTYANLIKGGWEESTSSAMKLMFGVGTFNSPKNMGAVSLATSTYRCPEIIETIATDQSTTIRNRQRQSIDVMDAPQYGLSYEKELDTHLFWGMQEFIHPKVINMSQKISKQYDTWPYRNYEFYIKKYEKQRREHGKITNPNLDRFALSEVNIETYRTPDFMLSCAQDYRKGAPGYQQHIWQATLGVEAVVFTNSPGSREEGGTPNFWAGNTTMPRAAQYKNIVVSIYKIPANNRLPFSHAYFPKAAFDEVIEKGQWVLGRKDNGYIAIYSQNPLTWGLDSEGLLNELSVSVPNNIWICEMGSKERWKSFSNFVKAITSSKVKCDGLNVAYHSPSLGAVVFGWSGNFMVAGDTISLRDYPRFDNPYGRTDFPSKEIVIKHKDQELVLDFANGRRVLK